MSEVLVFDPQHAGHHLNYLRLLVLAGAECGVRPTLVLTRAGRGSDEYRVQLSALADRFDADVLPAEQEAKLGGARGRWRLLCEAVARHRPEHLWVPYADGISQVAGVEKALGRDAMGGVAFSQAVLMRGRFAYPPAGLFDRVKSGLSRRSIACSPWRRLLILDPIPYEALVRREPGQRRYDLLPDPVEPVTVTDRGAARAMLGVPEQGRLIGVVGALDARKGVDRLIRAFIAADRPGDDRLLLVGRVRQVVRELLDGEARPWVDRGQIVVIDRYVSNAELDAAIAAMDVVAAPYPRHIGSASLVIRAAAAGKLALGSSFGWIGLVIDRFGLGLTCDPRNTAGFARAIGEALDRSADFALGEAGRRFVAFHTAANFTACWTRPLREALGLPLLPEKTWAWVNRGD